MGCGGTQRKPRSEVTVSRDRQERALVATGAGGRRLGVGNQENDRFGAALSGNAMKNGKAKGRVLIGEQCDVQRKGSDTGERCRAQRQALRC